MKTLRILTAKIASFKLTTQDEPALVGCSKSSVRLYFLLGFLLGSLIFLSGCQLGYYLHTGYHQTALLWNRVPIEKAIKSQDLKPEQIAKLKLAQEAKKFAEEELTLKSNGNYESFVSLDRDAVTYIVQVAYADQLKSYKWKFPFVGEVPYKGYFKRELAEDEAKSFSEEKYDTWIRGVRAYSTLGWFQDPVTSPMLMYREHDLVETIIHELTHTTIYIKNQSEFNERLATFVGVEGAKRFYEKVEGAGSETKRLIEEEQNDLKLFSKFISEELNDLRDWYRDKSADEIKDKKEARIREIQERFERETKPQLETDLFVGFSKLKLNNAILMSFETYISDLSVFENLYNKVDRDLGKFIKEISKLENSKTPDADLKALSRSI